MGTSENHGHAKARILTQAGAGSAEKTEGKNDHEGTVDTKKIIAKIRGQTARGDVKTQSRSSSTPLPKRGQRGVGTVI